MKKINFEKILLKIERFLPLFLMCSFIYIQSSKPSVMVSYVGWFNFFVHKLAHVLVFSFLFLFSCRAFRDKKLALIFTILYAFSDEYHQSFVATRNAAFSDVLIDSIAASGIYYLSEKYNKKIPHVIKEFFCL
jgi:VanZ family protein